ncbi:MAG TPA: hypothetical protein VFE96_02580 [Candidatus Bathyarchaeia archaeon]|nr:hypothetical protein [Candidatus Bathyarchaeia archaeon]
MHTDRSEFNTDIPVQQGTIVDQGVAASINHLSHQDSTEKAKPVKETFQVEPEENRPLYKQTLDVEKLPHGKRKNRVF